MVLKWPQPSSLLNNRHTVSDLFFLRCPKCCNTKQCAYDTDTYYVTFRRILNKGYLSD